MSKAAVWSLVLSFFFIPFGPFASIPAILLGASALTYIRHSRGQLRGQGLAIFGLILGGVGIPLTFAALVAAVLFIPPWQARSHYRPLIMECQGNLKQIGIALRMYQNENGGAYPENLSKLYEDNVYLDALNVFVCPGSNDRIPPHSGRRELPDAAAWGSYEYVAPPPNVSDCNTRVCWDKRPVHARNDQPQGRNVLFADGHVEYEPGIDPPAGVRPHGKVE